jgi:hypothetical protein
VRAGVSGIPSRQLVFGRSADMDAVTASSFVRGRANTLAAWLALTGLLIPAAEVQVYIGGAKFTVGRLGIMLLMIPALIALFQRGRRLQVPDFFACATAIWIIFAGTNAADSDSASSSVAEAIELCGGYLVARAFFFGPLALRAFISALKILTFTSILLGTADSISGRLIVHETFASLLQVTPIDAQYRDGALRAASTFDHAILFGAFCSFVGIILLYSERSVVRRALWVAFCFYGCVLSWSSSGLMSLFIGVSVYTYDRAMKRHPWRWRAFCGSAVLILTMFFVAANNPMGWIVSHLTLDPASGYFRIMIWDLAASKIAESPLIGFGVQRLDDAILDVTVDSVWLVMALRFGLPVVVLLILTSLTAMLPVGRASRGGADEHYVRELRTGFTLVLAMFMFVGLTVHYWNYLWIFWGICFGIRVSLNEYAVTSASRRAAHGSQMLISTRRSVSKTPV